MTTYGDDDIGDYDNDADDDDDDDADDDFDDGGGNDEGEYYFCDTRHGKLLIARQFSSLTNSPSKALWLIADVVLESIEFTLTPRRGWAELPLHASTREEGTEYPL